MAANLSAVMDDTDKVHQFHEDALANGLKVLPPDVNSGEYRFVPVDAKTLRYGLGAVKGTGESAIGAIIAARKEAVRSGPVRFLRARRQARRQPPRGRGAGARRRVRFARTTTARACSPRSASRWRRPSRPSATRSRRASSGPPTALRHSTLALVATERWDETRRLREEKTSLGFYLSGHPFTGGTRGGCRASCAPA